ncbi:hypothetical protein LPJ55_002501 [Coemansia sp. RSA 990]|nr:hypothetical protein LPJ55_002501 [Coemansia sp. RSA 990]
MAEPVNSQSKSKLAQYIAEWATDELGFRKRTTLVTARGEERVSGEDIEPLLQGDLAAILKLAATHLVSSEKAFISRRKLSSYSQSPTHSDSQPQAYMALRRRLKELQAKEQACATEVKAVELENTSLIEKISDVAARRREAESRVRELRMQILKRQMMAENLRRATSRMRILNREMHVGSDTSQTPSVLPEVTAVITEALKLQSEVTVFDPAMILDNLGSKWKSLSASYEQLQVLVAGIISCVKELHDQHIKEKRNIQTLQDQLDARKTALVEKLEQVGGQLSLSAASKGEIAGDYKLLIVQNALKGAAAQIKVETLVSETRVANLYVGTVGSHSNKVAEISQAMQQIRALFESIQSTAADITHSFGVNFCPAYSHLLQSLHYVDLRSLWDSINITRQQYINIEQSDGKKEARSVGKLVTRNSFCEMNRDRMQLAHMLRCVDDSLKASRIKAEDIASDSQPGIPQNPSLETATKRLGAYAQTQRAYMPMSRSQPSQQSELLGTSHESGANNSSRDEQENNSEETGTFSQPKKSDASSQLSSQNTDNTDDSDRDSGRNGASQINSKRRQRRHAHGSLPASDQNRTDAEGGQRRGGHKGGSTLHIPCKFFKHGNCTAGSGCYFSHDINLFVEKSVCKYFLKGNCKYGNKCALLHTGQNDGNGGRNQKSGNGGQRIQQNRTNGNPSAKNSNGRSGPNSGNKKDSKGNSEMSFIEAASQGDSSSGNSNQVSASQSALAQAYSQMAAGSGNEYTPGPSMQDKGAASSSDNSVAGKKVPNAWATGSIASKLHRDRESRAGSIAAQKERRRLADSGPGARQVQTGANSDVPEYLLAGEQYNKDSLSPLRSHFDHARNSAGDMEMNSRSQPIPRPDASSYNRAVRGNSSMPFGGMSVQESMLIDNLTLSHSTAHQSFAGSPFMTSSIPLLDHFKDIARGENASAGTSPHAQSFTRSPMIGSSGLLHNRHAFTAVDSSSLLQESGDGELGSGSLRPGYHSYLQSHHLDMSPAVRPLGGAQSIPASSDMFGRSLRSTNPANEPQSPMSTFAGANGEFGEANTSAGFLGSPASAGGNTPTGRLRSNSNTLSPSIVGPSSGIEIGNQDSMTGSTRVSARGRGFLMGESRLAAYSLNDAQSIPYDPALESSGSIWDTRAYTELKTTKLLSGSLGGKAIGQQRGVAGYEPQASSFGGGYYQQHGLSQSHWSQTGGSSPFASAIGGFNDHRQTAYQQQPFMGESALPGAISQRMQKPLGSNGLGAPRSYPHAGGLASSFGGIGSSMFALEASRAQNASANGSSTASDNVDDLFELEQDVPTQSRTNSNNSMAPNPQFIGMDGFSHRLAGLSLKHSDDSNGNSSGGRSIPSISAIARPAV